MSIERQNQCLHFLVDPSFQGVNRFFVLPFKDNAHQRRHTGYFIPTVQIKDYSVMMDRKNIFNHPVKMIKEHMIILQELQVFKGMIIHLVIY